MSHSFERRAVCQNNHVLDKVPFGDLFHYHKEVCPVCGDPKSNWRVLTLRICCEGVHWEDEKGTHVDHPGEVA